MITTPVPCGVCKTGACAGRVVQFETASSTCLERLQKLRPKIRGQTGLPKYHPHCAHLFWVSTWSCAEQHAQTCAQQHTLPIAMLRLGVMLQCQLLHSALGIVPPVKLAFHACVICRLFVLSAPSTHGVHKHTSRFVQWPALNDHFAGFPQRLRGPSRSLPASWGFA